MIRVLAQRLTDLMVVLWGVSVLVFLMIRFIPGDAVQIMLGANVEITPERLQALYQKIGLDKPMLEQYASWIGGIFVGDLGTSLWTGAPVGEEILARLGVTLELLMLSLGTAVAFAIPAGWVADHWSRYRMLAVFFFGIGLSSISHVAGTYVQNQHKLNPYYADLDGGRLPVARGYRLGADDRLRSDLIQALMCAGEFNRDQLAARHGVDFDHYFASELETLQPLVDDGLVVLDGRCVRATELGRILIRTIAMRFDAHLPRAPQGAQRFSATV